MFKFLHFFYTNFRAVMSGPSTECLFYSLLHDSVLLIIRALYIIFQDSDVALLIVFQLISWLVNILIWARDTVVGSPLPYTNPTQCIHNFISFQPETFSSNISSVIKSRRLRWSGHIARMGERGSAYRVLVGKPEGRKPLGGPKRK